MKALSPFVPWLLAAGTALAADVPIVDEKSGEFQARHLTFESRVAVDANCKAVFANLTETPRLAKLAPHLNGKASIAKAEKPGDSLAYELVRTDGSKNTGKLLLTAIEPPHLVQILVQPEHGPWLRVQEFRMYAPAGGDEKTTSCFVTYTETYNPKPLMNAAYDVKEIVQDVREPYMDVILRRLKNLAEGKEAGSKDEVEKLKEISSHFP